MFFSVLPPGPTGRASRLRWPRPSRTQSSAAAAAAATSKSAASAFDENGLKPSSIIFSKLSNCQVTFRAIKNKFETVRSLYSESIFSFFLFVANKSVRFGKKMCTYYHGFLFLSPSSSSTRPQELVCLPELGPGSSFSRSHPFCFDPRAT